MTTKSFLGIFLVSKALKIFVNEIGHIIEPLNLTFVRSVHYYCRTQAYLYAIGILKLKEIC